MRPVLTVLVSGAAHFIVQVSPSPRPHPVTTLDASGTRPWSTNVTRCVPVQVNGRCVTIDAAPNDLKSRNAWRVSYEPSLKPTYPHTYRVGMVVIHSTPLTFVSIHDLFSVTLTSSTSDA